MQPPSQSINGEQTKSHTSLYVEDPGHDSKQSNPTVASLSLAGPPPTQTFEKKKTDSDFDKWWLTYPGTDTFTYKSQSFTGTRGMRVKKDECKIKFDSIVEEGEYKPTELIAALEYEILQKKENSIKTKVNRLTFMQNSLTYLNQRSFEPFIELIREGKTIKESAEPIKGMDI